MYNLLTLLSYLLSGASISLAILKPDLPTWIFPIPAVFGWILGFMMVKKVSKPVHIVANVLGGLSIGVALDMICDSFPLFTISLAFILSTFAVRVILIRSMGYVKYLWFEPMMLIAGLGVFIAVNIIKHPGWYGWAIPAPMAFMSVMFSMVGVKEQKAFKRAATKELNVEVGQPAPDFSLPDENGKIVTVSEFKGVQPVLLLFVRGDWC
ncbi:MAG TPA: redoxin domain-containing protein, partial [Bacteroidia bacterium]|nr:redoxin domain-containing protein [Bacteroidia bacterium]